MQAEPTVAQPMLRKVKPSASATLDAIVIGAGPYGISIGAHLAPLGLNALVLGEPMESWSRHMPKGMHLKSEGFASDLFHPRGEFKLGQYCRENAIAYRDVGLPVSLETFTAYGLEFARRFVPKLSTTKVSRLLSGPNGFRVELTDGSILNARNVVVATGVAYLADMPPELDGLPRSLASHSFDHHALEGFKGRKVVVIGGGASAIDLAALLHEVGARVQIVSRQPRLYVHSDPPPRRSLVERLRRPVSTIGLGWKTVFYAKAPGLFHMLPEAKRKRITRYTLGPAGGWFMQKRIDAVSRHLELRLCSGRASEGGVRLEFETSEGGRVIKDVDHVITATGFRAGLDKLAFLDGSLRDRIKCAGKTPILSRSFEASVPGLYFVGPLAADSFGPVMRFATGAGFAARMVAKSLSGRAGCRRDP